MSCLLHRMSIRKYQDRHVEPEKIEYMMRAAMQAPSAHNQRPWEFYVVTNKELIQKLSKATAYSGCAAGAPVVIVPVYRKDSKVPYSIDIDMAACTENLWLAADEQGLGGVWIGIAPVEERMQAVEEILSLPDTVRPFALFAVGYSAETREQRIRFNPDRIHYVN